MNEDSESAPEPGSSPPVIVRSRGGDDRDGWHIQSVIKWKNHANTILETMNEWYLENKKTDVTIICEGRCIRAHRLVLALVPLFRRIMLQHSKERKSAPIIQITDLKFDSVKILLKWLYTGYVEVYQDDLASLMDAARLLHISKVEKACAKYLGLSRHGRNKLLMDDIKMKLQPGFPGPRLRNLSAGSNKSDNASEVHHDEFIGECQDQDQPLSLVVRKTDAIAAYPGSSADDIALPHQDTATAHNDFHMQFPVTGVLKSKPRRNTRQRKPKQSLSIREMLDSGNQDEDLNIKIEGAATKNKNSKVKTKLEPSQPGVSGGALESLALVPYVQLNSNSNSSNTPMTVEVDPGTSSFMSMLKNYKPIHFSPSKRTHIFPGETSPIKTSSSQQPLRDLDEHGTPIRRPPNAYMIFSNAKRKQVACENPGLTNNGVSVLLGHAWKQLEKDEKDSYYKAAMEAVENHKKLYPDYVYSPKRARIRKELKRKNDTTPTRREIGFKYDRNVEPMDRSSSVTISADEDGSNSGGGYRGESPLWGELGIGDNNDDDE